MKKEKQERESAKHLKKEKQEREAADEEQTHAQQEDSLIEVSSKDERMRNHVNVQNSLKVRESVLFIGTQFSILYTSMYSPAETATPCA